MNEVDNVIVSTHSVVCSDEPAMKKPDKINQVTHEESVQTSKSLTQKFEHLSPDNLPSAQSLLKMNEASKLDEKNPIDRPKGEALKSTIN